MKVLLKNFKSLIIFFIISIIFTGCTKKVVFEKIMLKITKADGTSFQISTELAKTQQEQTTGFMHRKKIPNGTGMLFIYNQDKKLSFWMKNTPTALSIAFIDSSGKIREIYNMEPFSTKSTKSIHSVRYALEVPQGWFSEQDIKIGDVLNISTLK